MYECEQCCRPVEIGIYVTIGWRDVRDERGVFCDLQCLSVWADINHPMGKDERVPPWKRPTT